MQWTRLAGRLSLSRADSVQNQILALLKLRRNRSATAATLLSFVAVGVFFASCSARLYAAATRADAECAVFGVVCRTVGLSAMFSADMISFCLYVLRDPSKRFRKLVPF